MQWLESRSANQLCPGHWDPLEQATAGRTATLPPGQAEGLTRSWVQELHTVPAHQNWSVRTSLLSQTAVRALGVILLGPGNTVVSRVCRVSGKQTDTPLTASAPAGPHRSSGGQCAA